MSQSLPAMIFCISSGKLKRTTEPLQPLRKATVVLILSDSCHENLKQRASASIGLKLSADSSHLNALFDLGINLRNSLMWLKGTLRCDIRACSPYWPTEPRTKFSTSLARYILLMSAKRAMRWKRKRINTSMREEWTVDPTSRVSLRDTPEED